VWVEEESRMPDGSEFQTAGGASLRIRPITLGKGISHPTGEVVPVWGRRRYHWIGRCWISIGSLFADFDCMWLRPQMSAFVGDGV